MWNGISDALLGKDSSTQLTKDEVDKVYEMMNAFIGREFEFHIPFPNNPDKEKAIMQDEVPIWHPSAKLKE